MVAVVVEVAKIVVAGVVQTVAAAAVEVVIRTVVFEECLLHY